MELKCTTPTLASVRFDAKDEFAKDAAVLFGFDLKELRSCRGVLQEYLFWTNPVQARKFKEWCEE